MNPTDDLPRAVANWVSMVIQQLSAEQTEVLRSCLEAPGPDVRVVFCMREGAVLLEVSNAVRRLELYREDVTSGNRMSRRVQPQRGPACPLSFPIPVGWVTNCLLRREAWRETSDS
jgi:hypothetical protein